MLRTCERQSPERPICPKRHCQARGTGCVRFSVAGCEAKRPGQFNALYLLWVNRVIFDHPYSGGIADVPNLLLGASNGPQPFRLCDARHQKIALVLSARVNAIGTSEFCRGTIVRIIV